MAIVGMIFMNSGVARVMYKVLMPKLFPKNDRREDEQRMEIHNDIVLTSMPKMEEQDDGETGDPPGANPVDEKKKLTASAVMAAANVIQA